MITVEVPEYFSLNKIADSGQCFNWTQIGDNTYSIIIDTNYIEVRQHDNYMDLSCDKIMFDTYWEHYFDLHNTSHIYQNIANHINPNDKFMLSAYEYGKGIYILHQPFFETLISYIISQRKSIPAIKTCLTKIREKFGTKMHGYDLNGNNIEYYTFPSAKILSNISEDRLKDCGVGYRAKYIIDASVWASSFKNLLSLIQLNQLSKSTNEMITLLKTINGVGDKVANCIALFALHRLDACPIDVWINKIITDDYHCETVDWLTDKYAGLLQQYAFYYKRHLN